MRPKPWRKVLVLSPADIFGAGLKLSLTGQADMPPAPPSEYVEALFDGYSDRFDTALVEDLGYCVPERLTALLSEVAGADSQFAKVIDLGCGTGLFGERIRLRTSWLEGYDLSQGMLTKAGEKGIYDRLGQADILHGIPAARLLGAERADLVVAADVLAYFGDLDPVMTVAANLTVDGGLVALSLEAGLEDSHWLLQPSLRYCHGEAYLRRLLDQHGLDALRVSREPIRRDGTAIISGPSGRGPQAADRRRNRHHRLRRGRKTRRSSLSTEPYLPDSITRLLGLAAGLHYIDQRESRIRARHRQSGIRVARALPRLVRQPRLAAARAPA